MGTVCVMDNPPSSLLQQPWRTKKPRRRLSRTDQRRKKSRTDEQQFAQLRLVHEMLQASQGCGQRESSEPVMSFHPFCVFTKELQRHVPRQPVVSRQSSAPTPSHRPVRREPRSKSFIRPEACKYEVFLGGSCNPTTWRRDEAIPKLKELGISYYNPQVASWHPGLIALEEEAKQSASVLFFVIDNQTRAVSSMLEASYLAACGRRLVMVVNRLTGPDQVICGEKISNIEYNDLNRTQNYLQDLVERQGLPVFEKISSALDCTNKVLRENVRVQDLNLADNAVPVRNTHITMADKLYKLREVFDSQDCEGRGHLTVPEVCTALRVATGRSVCPQNVRLLLAQIRSITGVESDSPADPCPPAPAASRVTFDEFCVLTAELRGVRQPWRGVLELLVQQVLAPLTRVAEWVLPQRLARQLSGNGNSNSNSPPADLQRDVYLGGTLSGGNWRQQLAIPILKKNGLSFEQPASQCQCDRLVPTEAARLERCRVLLFVITAASRAPAHMTLAAHYIGLGSNVVLCIQMLPDNCVIQGEKLSPTAIKDYNRGRSYLSDLATRRGVPVFDSVEEAVQCTVERCRRTR